MSLVYHRAFQMSFLWQAFYPFWMRCCLVELFYSCRPILLRNNTNEKKELHVTIVQRKGTNLKGIKQKIRILDDCPVYFPYPLHNIVYVYIDLFYFIGVNSLNARCEIVIQLKYTVYIGRTHKQSIVNIVEKWEGFWTFSRYHRIDSIQMYIGGLRKKTKTIYASFICRRLRHSPA